MAQTGVQCPQCGCKHTKVTRTLEREVKWGGKLRTHTRRYRECERCFHSFTTVETIEDKRNLGFPPREAQPEPKIIKKPSPFIRRYEDEQEEDNDEDNPYIRKA